MAKQKKKANTLSTLLDFIDVADAALEKVTGKNIASWLKEFQQQPKELPQGEQVARQQPTMPLADAYAVLGLPRTASLEEVKRNYKHLAVVFHPDKGGYAEAMKLLNQAYERICLEKEGGKA